MEPDELTDFRQREVVKLLVNADKPLTIQEIYEGVRGSARIEVHRVLERLNNSGLIEIHYRETQQDRWTRKEMCFAVNTLGRIAGIE